MANNRASRLRESMEKRLKELTPTPTDPSKAWDDSTAVSMERIAQGTASPVDKERAYLAGRMKRPEPEKLTDYGQARARIKAGQGDRADSIHVGLQPRATAPTAPSFSFREGVDEQGNSVFLRGNSRAGTLEPVKTTYRPSSGKKDDDGGEKEYISAIDATNNIQKEISQINSILNDPANKNGAEVLDEDGQTRYFDRASLEKHRNGLLKQQTIHARKTAKIELEYAFPPAEYAGKKKRDKASGILFQSDGKSWNPVE